MLHGAKTTTALLDQPMHRSRIVKKGDEPVRFRRRALILQ